VAIEQDIVTTATAVLGADANAVVAAAAGLRLMGFAAAAPGVAVFEIVHGATGSAGTNVIPLAFTAEDQRSQVWFGPEGIPVPNGLSVDYTSGSPSIVLFTRTQS
tara:strand:+ start:484 stop:798 length:315 start_codon:yes stop_codon:yes gene_type:complete